MKQSQDDIYELPKVRAYLNLPSVMVRSQDLRVFAGLGDRLAVSFLKLLDDEALLDSTTAAKISVALEIAFQHPSSIEWQVDKTPRVALFLLRFIHDHSTDVRTREHLRSTITVLESMK